MPNDETEFHSDVGSRVTPDSFGRRPFAQRLAETVVSRQDPESLVIGLYGSWGEGKSTVLDYMAQTLEGSELVGRVVLIRFNPWMFSSELELSN